MTYKEQAAGQTQWQVEKATQYTHTIDIQLYNDRPVLQLLGDVTGKDMVDIGCGNGYVAKKLSAARRVVGVDSSAPMIEQATALRGAATNLEFQIASADELPYPPESFEAAICSLTIINYPTVAMVKKSFAEVARVLKSGGRYVISLSHPLTLHEATQYCRTDWEPGQRQDNLVPGESFRRQLKGKGGEWIGIENYYWPPQVLTNFAARYGLKHAETIEPLATKDELAMYSGQLELIRENVPFFLVMAYDKAAHG